MKVPKDFPARVAGLSQSTPREAIANLLSALMPRMEAKVRPPAPPPAPVGKYYPELDKLVLFDGEPTPMRKLYKRRAPRSRKPLPAGVLTRAVPNPKKPGSKIALRYAQYTMGKSAYWHTRFTDLTATEILWDIDHGFVTFTEEQ